MNSKYKNISNAGYRLAVSLVCLLTVTGVFGEENTAKRVSMMKVKSPAAEPGIRITVNKELVEMGRSLEVAAQAMYPDGKPAAEHLVLTYVNGKRWGAHELTDERGRATILFPLPNPGIAEIQVEIQGNSSELKKNDQLYTGRRISANANVSNIITVDVVWREMNTEHNDPDHLVGIQWEPWFTPHVVFWQTATAVPLLGFYDSYNRDVMRQHVLWFVDLGVDFILADWSNHIWGKNHWNERSDNSNTILHATTLLFETLADMRTEGIPVPKIVIMPGLSNGPPATMTALNEELAWIYESYACNPRFEGLLQNYDGKPLVAILDTGALAHPKGTAESAYRIPFIRQTIGLTEEALDSLRANMRTPVDDSHFTVRWMSTQLQTTGHEKLGYWTWMDGTIQPVVTYRDGKPEAVTVTPSFFAGQGWKGPGAYGRRGGATYIETFKSALENKPRIVMLHQFNEFAGQLDGHGYGPNKDIYVDCYSIELSDDLEPVSLTAPAIRGNGGWGFYYLNLTRALLDLYRQNTPETTVMAVSSPKRDEVVISDQLEIEWSWAGKAPSGFSISINNRIISRTLSGTRTRIDLKEFEEGPIKLVVTADNTKSNYVLSYTEDSLPLKKTVPASGEVEFILKRKQ
jgi:hypothetical protein